MRVKDLIAGVKNGTVDPEAVICVEVPGGGLPIMKEAKITPTYDHHTEYEAVDEDGCVTTCCGPVLYARA